MTGRRFRRAVLATAVFLPLALVVGGGCLEAPGIADTWTRLEILGSEPAASTPVSPGAVLDVDVNAQITFRAIRTGDLAVELRRGDAALAAVHPLRAEDEPLERSRRVESLLAATTPVAGASRTVTGFDHLMMDVRLEFSAPLPADLDSTEGLWLLLFFGEGEEVNREGLPDTVQVSPADMDSLRILATGFALRLQRGTAP